MTTAALPSVVWTAAADPALLRGYEVVAFDELRREVAGASARRDSLANPAQPWLDRLARSDALAVTGVRLESVEDLHALHAYVLEPAWRAGLKLLVECDARLSELDPARFRDPAYTLERALYAAARIWRPSEVVDAGAGTRLRARRRAAPRGRRPRRHDPDHRPGGQRQDDGADRAGP